MPRSQILWVRPPFNKHLLSTTDGHKLSKVLSIQKVTRHGLYPHGTPRLVGEAGIESRIQHSRGQDKLRVLWESRAEGPPQPGRDEHQGGLPAGGDA